MDREGIKEVLGRFPRERTHLLPALHAVQEENRWIPAWAMEEISAYLRVPKSEVHGVASSFPELRLKEPGKHIARVCTGLPCYLRGAPSVLRALEDALGVQAISTSPDGAVTLEEASCLFICSMAPAIELDGACQGCLTPEEAVSRMKAVVEKDGRPR